MTRNTPSWQDVEVFIKLKCEFSAKAIQTHKTHKTHKTIALLLPS